jgi:hypothetical protein
LIVNCRARVIGIARSVNDSARRQDSNGTTKGIGHQECGQNLTEITFVHVSEDLVHTPTITLRSRTRCHNVQFQVREKRIIVENFWISEDAFMLRLIGHCELNVVMNVLEQLIN